MSSYHDTYRASLDGPEHFWQQAAAAIDWYRTPTRILDRSHPPFYRWFPNGELNTCYNALDRHIEAGHAERTALVHDSPVTSTRPPTPTRDCATKQPASPASSPTAVLSKAIG
ncbi:acetyl-coenzyme A synthetase N-terminal domain-containing protein [Streptomyces sp. NPDC092129]|uniref:acetyl-coenzyme A synthetase N-terminal domain-containing protein n=1 Tax=Streptomyces sp. NPDC092129 TaxID=3366010 RepID=UPI0038005D76